MTNKGLFPTKPISTSWNDILEVTNDQSAWEPTRWEPYRPAAVLSHPPSTRQTFACVWYWHDKVTSLLENMKKRDQ